MCRQGHETERCQLHGTADVTGADNAVYATLDGHDSKPVPTLQQRRCRVSERTRRVQHEHPMPRRQHVAEPHLITLCGRYVRQLGQVNHPGEASVEVKHREGAVWTCVRDGREEVRHGLGPVAARWRSCHHVTHAHTGQAAMHDRVVVLRAGCRDKEPADHYQPQPAEVAGEQGLCQSCRYHQPAKDNPGAARGPVSRGAVTAQPPQRRRQHPPAVQRDSGHQVEDGENRR